MGVWGWWAFDIFTLIGSYLSVSVISAQTIMRSLGLLTFMVPVGFKVACQVLIGQNIGRGNERAIRHYYKMCMYFAVALGLVQVALLYGGRELVLHTFTSEENVLEEMRKCWLVFMVFVIFDTIQGIAAAAISAAQQQTAGAFVTASAYWVIGIPLTLYLVFVKDGGIYGIWIGPTCAVLFLSITYFTMYLRMDWQAIISDARE